MAKMTKSEEYDLISKKGLLTPEEFESLTQRGRYARLKADFPDAATGQSRTKTALLLGLYIQELEKGTAKADPVPEPRYKIVHEGTEVADMEINEEVEKLFDKGREYEEHLEPEMKRRHEADIDGQTRGRIADEAAEDLPAKYLPVPKGLEDMPKAEVKAQLPVRGHRGLYFVIAKGDPNRDLTRKEMMWLDDVVDLFPKLGPKLQSGPLGVPNRRVVDPHKKDRRRVNDAIKNLKWQKILVLRKGDQVQQPGPEAQVLSEQM